MNERDRKQAQSETLAALDGLFLWRNQQIVLVVEQRAGKWVIARAWTRDDRLSDVRHWRFSHAEPLAAQLRRLTHEATGSRANAAGVAEAALAWTAAQPPPVERRP